MAAKWHQAEEGYGIIFFSVCQSFDSRKLNDDSIFERKLVILNRYYWIVNCFRQSSSFIACESKNDHYPMSTCPPQVITWLVIFQPSFFDRFFFPIIIKLTEIYCVFHWHKAFLSSVNWRSQILLSSLLTDLPCDHHPLNTNTKT